MTGVVTNTKAELNCAFSDSDEAIKPWRYASPVIFKACSRYPSIIILAQSSILMRKCFVLQATD